MLSSQHLVLVVENEMRLPRKLSVDIREKKTVQSLSLKVPQHLEDRKRKKTEKIKPSRTSQEKENQQSRVSPRSPRRYISGGD